MMEYADGGTLSERIVEQATTGLPFQTRQVLRWLAQLASALQHVHALRVLHRDLKTQNVFLNAAGDIKLGDFGISRALSTRTNLAETVCGTPYCTPAEALELQPQVVRRYHRTHARFRPPLPHRAQTSVPSS